MMKANAGINLSVDNQDQEFIQKGIDIWMIRDNLTLSYENRAAQHQDTLNTIEALETFRDHKRARPSIASQVADPKPR
jgi:hypothetical protein